MSRKAGIIYLSITGKVHVNQESESRPCNKELSTDSKENATVIR